MNHVMHTSFVPVALVEQARALAAHFPASAGMWPTPCGPADAPAPTHFVVSGHIGPEFADLMPLTQWRCDETGAWVQTFTRPGQPEAIAAAAGVDEAAVSALLGACDVSDQPLADAMNRLGFVVFTNPLEEPSV